MSEVKIIDSTDNQSAISIKDWQRLSLQYDQKQLDEISAIMQTKMNQIFDHRPDTSRKFIPQDPDSQVVITPHRDCYTQSGEHFEGVAFEFGKFSFTLDTTECTAELRYFPYTKVASFVLYKGDDASCRKKFSSTFDAPLSEDFSEDLAKSLYQLEVSLQTGGEYEDDDGPPCECELYYSNECLDKQLPD